MNSRHTRTALLGLAVVLTVALASTGATLAGAAVPPDVSSSAGPSLASSPASPTVSPAPPLASSDRTRARESAPSTGRRSSVHAAAPVSGYDETRISVDLRPGGSAQWTVDFRYRIRNSTDQRAFDRTARSITDPPGEFVEGMRSAVRRAERRTGRDMEVGNGTVSTFDTFPAGREGVVRFRFTWYRFAPAAGDDRRRVSGELLPSHLDRSQTLWIEWPDGVSTTSVSPDPTLEQSHAVGWSGEIQFRSEDPQIELVGWSSGERSWLPIAAAIAALAAVAIAGLGWYGRRRWRTGDVAADSTQEAAPPTEGSSAPGSGEPASSTASSEPASPAATGDAASAGAAADAAPSPAADGTAPSSTGGAIASGDGRSAANDGRAPGDAGASAAERDPRTELLSDEERVLRHLEAADGRMRQQELLERVEWSRTKTSDVVNEMHEAEQIELYRLGRENVLALPGVVEV